MNTVRVNRPITVLVHWIIIGKARGCYSLVVGCSIENATTFCLKRIKSLRHETYGTNSFTLPMYIIRKWYGIHSIGQYIAIRPVSSLLNWTEDKKVILSWFFVILSLIQAKREKLEEPVCTSLSWENLCLVQPNKTRISGLDWSN